MLKTLGFATTLALAVATTAPTTAQADVIKFGNDNFGVKLKLGNDQYNHREKTRKHYRDDRISSRRAQRIIRREGFYDVSNPRYRPDRGVYVARAEDRRGRDYRVVVDAYDGGIIRARRLR